MCRCAFSLSYNTGTVIKKKETAAAARRLRTPPPPPPSTPGARRTPGIPTHAGASGALPLRSPKHEERDEGGGDGAGRRLRELRRLPLLELPGDRFDSPAVPPPSDSLASSSHRLLLRRMSCSGSPTTPAPTRCSGPPRWTWTSCTAPARRTRWRRPPACVGGGQYSTLLVFPLLTPLDFFRVWPPTAPVWYRSVLEVIDRPCSSFTLRLLLCSCRTLVYY